LASARSKRGLLVLTGLLLGLSSDQLVPLLML
jgi:hypothetical protein